MIDWQRVTDLHKEIGSSGFSEIVDLFRDEVETVLARLSKAPDPTKYEEDMHFLKGSALNLGFVAFGDHCDKAERQAASGNPDIVDIDSVLASYVQSRRAFMARANQFGFKSDDF